MSCHNGNAHQITSANFSPEREKMICQTCHTSIGGTEFPRKIHEVALSKDAASCVNCHGSHGVHKNKFAEESEGCVTCHLNPDYFSEEEHPHLVEFVENYQLTVHAVTEKDGKEAATCVDCHGNHLRDGLDAAREKVSKEHVVETCGKCHTKVVEEFYSSMHGQVYLQGVDVAPTCTDCHGEHEISAITSDHFDKLKRKQLCMDCHVDNEKVVQMSGELVTDITSYEKSAHYQALQDGNEKAAVCSDCHTGHHMLPATNDSSEISKQNVAKTCGMNADCHLQEYRDYETSIHKQALDDGVVDSPTCTDCHGNHQIEYQHGDGDEWTIEHNQFVSKLCSDCHASVELAEKYDLPLGKTDSYYDSYHGLALRANSKYAANCGSCHGFHDIKPSTDPESSIHPDNLSETCGSCHPGANIDDEFRQVHLSYEESESEVLFYISKIYVYLIILTIGGMFIHNVLDFFKKRKIKKKYRAEIERARREGKFYIRMTKNERIQHFLFLTSFLILVFTGFYLAYPDSILSDVFWGIFGSSSFEVRSITHRVAGAIMIVVSLYHIYWALFTKRGRKFIIDMLPVFQDAKDMLINVKYITGLSHEHPKFDRFTYMEKAEYWALVWGTVVMSATGLALWFNNFFLAEYPKMVLDVATVIHFYEAWLATLAIIVWHFYFVIFNPVVFPLNKAVIYGTLDEFMMEHEHPLELEKIEKERGGSDGNATEQTDTETDETDK
jgi:cytochrome b subunit of formate dehydrogenase